MKLINNLYCSACSAQLISTGYEPYSEEAYYVCPACSTDYMVTETGDNMLIVQAELKEKYEE